MMDEEIKSLLVKYITGNADAKERQFVRRWLDESQENVDYFTSLKAAWDDALHHPGRRSVNTDDAFDRLRKRLVPYEETVEPLPEEERRPRRLFSIPRVAVAAALLLVIAGTGLYVYRKNSAQTIVQTAALDLFVPNGKMKRIMLPDSTEVWLNAGTHFSYSASYGEKTREVNLEGEGYFVVKHMEQIPFIVRAQGHKIRDIGTIFTVSAYPGNAHFRTAVIEGEVAVSMDTLTSGHDEYIRLTRNEVLNLGEYNNQQHRTEVPSSDGNEASGEMRITEGANGQVSLAATMDVYAGWKDQLLVFEEETFDEVAQRLERTFDVKIRITSSQLAGYRYTGRFNKVPNITEVLKIIKETTPIAYRSERDTIIISMNRK